MTPQIKNFSLTIKGLEIAYTYNSTTYIKCDPLSTCDLLTTLGFIEGFDIDKNGEPIILFTTGYRSYSYELWCNFIKQLPLTYRFAEMIIEGRESYKAYKKSIAAINNLLQPLKAAA